MSQSKPSNTKSNPDEKAARRQFLRHQKELAQLAAIETGVGFSSDKIVAIYLDASRSTIWKWVRDGLLPRPVRITPQFSRWENSDLKAFKDGHTQKAREGANNA